ncbi:MAG: hypothetical protein QXF28_00790 [Nitrososphaerota archaeon]
MSERKDLVKILFCCGLIEEKISQAYESIASRIDDEVVRVLLEYIAEDSLKHSKILQGVSKYLGVDEVDIEECGELLGITAIRIIEDSKKSMMGIEKISLKELASEFDDLVNLEKYFGEEYFNLIQIKLLGTLIEHEGIEIGFLKDILEYIVEDERRHEKILNAIKTYALQG